MQFNPDVTVRFRGVMEKCTYCVQRIHGGKIARQKENREMQDGEIVDRPASRHARLRPSSSATSTTRKSRVSKMRKVERRYALLAEVGTHPRTRFLGKIRNPNPEMEGSGTWRTRRERRRMAPKPGRRAPVFAAGT